MKKPKYLVLLMPLLALSIAGLAQQNDTLLDYIQQQSDIREGGSSIYAFKDVTYVISVASLAVGTKNELDCKKVGSAKAKKEMLSFINGSDITSYTELNISETVNETLEGTAVLAQQQYAEYIREVVIGNINQTVPLGGWYSEDKSVYYYAIYRIIEQFEQ